MKTTRIIKIIALLIIVMLALFLISGSVLSIDLTSTTGSLKITKREKGKGLVSGIYPPLPGVEFKIYKVSDTETSTTATVTERELKGTGITGVDGTVTFSELELGRYLVIETDAPEAVLEKTANFLVDIPSTNATGDGLIYNVEVEAKNETVYGGVVLTKQNKNGTALKGVTFKLQKLIETNWEDYPNSTLCNLETDESGEITLTGLPAGNYRFVETGLGNNLEYILDNKTTYTFNVALGDNSTTIVTPEKITVLNDNPKLTKEKLSIVRDVEDNNSVKDGINSLDIGDTVNYKVEVDIPTKIAELATYKITDTMDNGLTLKKDTITVTAENKFIKDTDYTVSTLENMLEIVFTDVGKTKLSGKEKVEIKYDAILNENADATSKGNKNSVKLTYSTIVKENYQGIANTDIVRETMPQTTTVYTGGISIEKRAETENGTLLSGAIFKLADTKANAKAGKYIKDKSGNEITLTTGEAKELGKASYKGLSYGTYYLVEVQAPTYEENGEIKYYNLLKNPVQVEIDANTYKEKSVKVVNKKGVWDKILPMTGSTSSFIMILVGIGLLILSIILHKIKK